jgi:phosphate transport system permease protein
VVNRRDPSRPERKIRTKRRNADRYAFFVIALVSLVTLATIVYFIFAQAFPFLGQLRLVPDGQGTITKYGETFTPTKLGDLFTGKWQPESDVEEFFGMLPMIVATTVITLGAMLLAIPFGLSAAVFVSEIGPRWLKDVFKAVLELLAAVPSIVYGLFGLIVLSPYVREAFGLVGGKTGATAAVVLSVMALPTIASLAEDALHAVPNAYREASMALGATKWQTIWRTLIPSASSGIVGAVILGMGRAVGETMAVLFVAGNAPFLTWNIFKSMRPITSGIALDMLESVRGSAHYHALFAMGAVLLLIALAMNWTAEWFHGRLLRRQGVREG